MGGGWWDWWWVAGDKDSGGGGWGANSSIWKIEIEPFLGGIRRGKGGFCHVAFSGSGLGGYCHCRCNKHVCIQSVASFVAMAIYRIRFYGRLDHILRTTSPMMYGSMSSVLYLLMLFIAEVIETSALLSNLRYLVFERY